MELVIRTAQGLIEGDVSKDGKTRIFKGVPYAEPPVGKLRFARSVPKKPWIGVRTCKSFGPQAFQADKTKGDLYPKEFYSVEMPPMSEDCLYLNIWTPAEVNEKLPVLIYIHGGAYMHGYGSEATMDGEGMAKKNVIMVTINYRVGALGFFAHDELEKENAEGISGNYGYWDQINALKWVYENIEAFGGDKERITISGQSAGCMSVQTLVSTDVTRGLIHGAILQSGGGIPGFARDYSLEHQKQVSLELMELLGAKNIEDLRNMSPENICYGAYEINGKHEGLMWMPNVDGYLLKDTVMNLALDGKIHDIPYIIGSTKDEMGNGTAELLVESARKFALNQEKLGKPPVYVYHFEHDLPGSDDGAFHSCELWYEFETLDRCWRPMTEHDYEISEEMSTQFANYVKKGNPNSDDVSEWKPFTETDNFVMAYK
ncbi:MAG: carboxylesterase family protein [Clostridia bacterium]|nr:carboxylesterase family protein [Clostridia bacterium]